jgi:hypothetical protein
MPIFDIDVNDLSGLGQATLAALENSKKQVPHPALNEWNELFDPVRKGSRSQIVEHVLKVCKERDDSLETNRVVFVPTKNLGPRDGFSPLFEKERSSAPTVAEVGAALKASFGDAE